MYATVLLLCFLVIKEGNETISFVIADDTRMIDSIDDKVSKTDMAGLGHYPDFYETEKFIAYVLGSELVEDGKLTNECCRIEGTTLVIGYVSHEIGFDVIGHRAGGNIRIGNTKSTYGFHRLGEIEAVGFGEELPLVEHCFIAEEVGDSGFLFTRKALQSYCKVFGERGE